MPEGTKRTSDVRATLADVMAGIEGSKFADDTALKRDQDNQARIVKAENVEFTLPTDGLHKHTIVAICYTDMGTVTYTAGCGNTDDVCPEISECSAFKSVKVVLKNNDKIVFNALSGDFLDINRGKVLIFPKSSLLMWFLIAGCIVLLVVIITIITRRMKKTS